MKVAFSLSFYHIPKFLKNDLVQRPEINIHHPPVTTGMECSFLSFNEGHQSVMVEPSGIEPLTSCVQ
ncbi:hypothetical protein, partial [Mesorhizobium sp.]|uniref:hypothetical protein n=1 Tax=Mesorhizobium sp. TaxID=1871066 RepID=UPI0025B8AB94